LRSRTSRLGQQLTGRATEHNGFVGNNRMRAVRGDDAPATLVDEAMVVAAEQQSVAEIGGAAR
jgi:hypothetical protein